MIIAGLQEALAANVALQQQLAATGEQAAFAAEAGSIPRPRGKKWSLQVAMGMATPEKNHDVYRACMVSRTLAAPIGSLHFVAHCSPDRVQPQHQSTFQVVRPCNRQSTHVVSGST